MFEVFSTTLEPRLVAFGKEQTLVLGPAPAEATVFLVDQGNVRQPIDEVIPGSNELAVRFTPRVRGALEVVVSDVSHRIVVTAPLFSVVELDGTADFTRTYVDRLDTCLEGPFRTRSGRVLCTRDDNEVWVYLDTGALDTHFPGTQLAVHGDEIWTTDYPGLDHRTDLGDAGLRFDGRVSAPVGLPWGDSAAGVALRGTQGGLVEGYWDGGSLGGITDLGYPDLAEEAIALRLPDGGVLQVGEFKQCTVRKGCQQAQCPSVFACLDSQPIGLVTFLGATSRDVWRVVQSNGHLRLGRSPRASPLRLLLAGTPPQLDVDGTVGIWNRTNTTLTVLSPVPLKTLANTTPAMWSSKFGTLLPESDEAGDFMWHWQHQGMLVSATTDYLLAAESSFVLRIHAR
jgi:hypothetical protein